MSKDKVLFLISTIPNKLWKKYSLYVPSGGNQLWVDKHFHACIMVRDITGIDVIGDKIKIWSDGGCFQVGQRIRDCYLLLT